MNRWDRRFLVRGLLLFWSCWLSIVFASNLTDGLKQAGILPEAWPFASGNFQLIRQTIEIYGLGAATTTLLFVGVVVFQVVAAALFWRAFIDREAVTSPDNPRVLQAFIPTVGVFAAFLIADELFIVYDRLPGVETTHMLVLVALLVTYMLISMLCRRT